LELRADGKGQIADDKRQTIPVMLSDVCAAAQAELLLPGEIVAEIIAHAQIGYPDEVCGIIAARSGVGVALYRGQNVSPTRQTAYELDAETLARQIEFEEQGLTLAAIYHSHPAGPETPSPTDVARAFYPDSVYIICSLAEPDRPSVRGFRIVNGQVQEVLLVSGSPMNYVHFRKGLGFTCSCLQRVCAGMMPVTPAGDHTSDEPRLEARSRKLDSDSIYTVHFPVQEASS
jgi:proteasome lid subunit RPN8/RPN11